MFKIENVNTEESGKVLVFSENLFHEALKDHPESKARYHVTNEKGEDFDIVYWDNDDDIEPKNAYPSYVKPPFMVKYLVYDENDRNTLYLDYFEGLDTMMFEELNEYTIVISKIVLNFTDLEIWCTDPRIHWFIDPNPRLHVVETLPLEKSEERCFYIQEQIRTGFEDNNFNKLSNTYAFHNLFFLQWILNGKSLSDYKYMTVQIDGVAGIGGLLSGYRRYQEACLKFGLKFAAPDKDHFGKYPRDMVERYFSVDLWNPDANETNTLVVPNIVIFTKTKLIQTLPGLVDKSVIAAPFREEMDEYFDAVFGDKKTLGILIRGTDYIATGLSGTRKMATVPQMIPTIRQWMAEYGYEKLFLATEDNDILKQMRDAFGRTLVALSQQRLTTKDLKTGQILSEYEKETSGTDYLNRLEDTTINYFYALYILSRCNGFLCSGQCNGWDTVLSLNGGAFERSYKFTVGVNGDPRTESWKVIRPVTAGMVARAAYPTDKSFYMTYRFDLKEAVNPTALETAWRKITRIYPYVTYATVLRKTYLVLSENPLPFVIRESAEVIEPSTPEANFHTVTITYLGNTLWFYVDHVPYDGTGFKYVFESFFYHYYSILDGCDYPVPEGIHTERDGVVPEQDTDAYLQANPVNPQSLMSSKEKQPIFEFPECKQTSLFLDKTDCRGFCISIPSEQFMRYAKAVKGSPVSVLSNCLPQAIQRVHSENILPIAFMLPVSIRKVMGNTNSLLHQVVHYMYNLEPKDFLNKEDDEWHVQFRAGLKEFSLEDRIRMISGVYRSICEGYAKAFHYGALDKILVDQRKNYRAVNTVSYLGTLRTGAYGNRIRMTAFHVMPGRGISLQVTEIGDHFYIDWYQGFDGDTYVRAMRDILTEKGISGVTIERVE